jgi:carbon-monoxide dehydrogenase large subunit
MAAATTCSSGDLVDLRGDHREGYPYRRRSLEAAEADLRFAEGRFEVAGTDRALALLDVAALGRAKGTPLETYRVWTRQ